MRGRLNDQRSGRFLAWFDSAYKIALALGAVVTLIGGIVGLVYLLLPNPAPPTPLQKATMTYKGSLPRISLGDFLVETGQDDAGYSDAELAQLGNEYEFDVTADGLRNKSTAIFWNLRGLDASELPFKERKRWIHQPLTSFKPTAESYARTAKVWIQYPPFQGTFFAEIAIEYPEYTTLFTLRTRRFTGTTQRRETSQPGTKTKTIKTVTTTPASIITTVETTESTTTATTTIDGTTTTSTVPTFSTVTNTTTIPARTSTITKVVPAETAPGRVPIVRPNAKLASP